MSQPGDPLEIDADRAARQVVHPSPSTETMPPAPAGRGAGGTVAAALPDETRAFFEPRFGADLSAVRIHTDSEAGRLNQTFGAQAFTHGHDIYFAQGRFRPETEEGRHLIAHEIAHVVQTTAADDTIHRNPDPSYSRYEHQPDDGRVNYGRYDFQDDFPNAAIADGVPKEYWDPAIEQTLWRIGSHKAAQGMRDCRQYGMRVCSKILTYKDVERWYADGRPPAATWGQCSGTPATPGSSGSSAASTPSALGSVAVPSMAVGAPMAAGVGMLAPTPVPLTPPPVSLPPVMPPTTVPTVPGFPTYMTPPAVVPAPAPVAAPVPAPAPTPIGSVGMAAPAVAAGLYVVAGGVALVEFGDFQQWLWDAGYILLPDPFQACVTGCHPSIPDATPLSFVRPSGPRLTGDWMSPQPYDFTKPETWPQLRKIPQTWLTPGPDEGPWTDLWPDVDEEPEQERRRRNRKITLRLPRAKGRYLDRYERMVATRELVHDKGYSRPDPSDPQQARRWRAELRPGAPGGMDATLFRIGTAVLQSRFGMDQDRAENTVLVPSWSRTTAHIPMSVDHIIELQLTFPHDRGWANSIANWALLDLSTNSSVGSRLYNNIERERLDLFAETWDFSYLFVPLVFETVVEDNFGSVGEHWDIHEIRRGDHVLVLLDWFNIPRPPGY